MILNQNWHVSGGDGNGHSFDIDAQVPGCLHTDLQRAGLLPDLYYRDNSKTAQWVENCHAVYTCRFTLTDSISYTHLRFGGLDVYATVKLNGTLLGETNDMHIPWTFPVKDILKKGENVLEVGFRSPIKEVEDLPKRNGAFSTERLYTRRIQCTYGWDWVDRFVTMGIFRDVALITAVKDTFPPAEEGIYVYTDEITPFGAKIGIELAFPEISGDGWVDVTILSPTGKCVFSRKRRILENTVRIAADIAAPELWYPSGYGEQPLYTLIVTTGEEEKRIRFGIRKVVVMEPEDEPGSQDAKLAEAIRQNDFLKPFDKNEGSSPFWVVVNGVRVFCQGANWVPCEPFPSEETPEKIRCLITLAKEGRLNMLRVWGGGIFERPEFYEACDEAGILVTQDFLMACGSYPEEDEDFRRLLSEEARSAACALRNHPCLVWWSGDNENAVWGDENMNDYSGRRAALECIAPVLRETDPRRPFLPSSPYGGSTYGSATRGTTHNTLFLGDIFAWIRKNEWKDYITYLDRFLSRFNAEQPALGMPFVSSLRRFLSDDDIFGGDTSMSEYHTKSGSGSNEITIYGYIERMAAGLFGTFTDGADRTRKMQWLQAEWVRVSMELFRRHAWYASGIVFWMYNDCWPAANGWSLVDYYAQPKPAYYTFRRCAGPVIFSFGGPDENGDGNYVLWLCQNGLLPHKGQGRVYLYNVVTGAETDLGTFAFDKRDAGAEPVWKKENLILAEDTVLLCDAEWEDGADRAFCLPCALSNMPIGPAVGPTVEKETATEIVITSSVTLPYAFIDPEGRILSENGVFMKIGERRIISKR